MLQTSNKVRVKNIPWWNHEINLAIQNQKAALAKYRLTHLYDDLTQFRIRRAQARRLIRSSKRISWHKFINSTEEDTHTNNMWWKIQILNNSKPPPSTIILPLSNGLLT